MSRLSTVFLGIALAVGLALPAVPAHAGSPRPILLAKKDKKAKKPPALEKGMKVVTMGDAVIVDDPSEEGEEVGRVAEGQVLTIVRLKKDGGWVRVKGPDGVEGWLRAAEVVPKEFYDAQGEDGGAEPKAGKGKKDKKGDKGGDVDEGDEGEAADSDAGEDDDGKKAKGKKGKKGKAAKAGEGDDEGSDDGEGDEGSEGDEGDDADSDAGAGAGTGLGARAAFDRKLRFAAGAQLSYLSRAQTFTSDGNGLNSNYTLTNGSLVIGVGGRVTYMMGKLELGGELGVSTTFGNDGVTVEGVAEPLAWTEQLIDARVLGGYHVAPGYLVSARLGYRVLAITIDKSEVIKQPSERLTGVALGLEVSAYALAPKLVVRLGFETLVAAEVVQTAGYRDGTASTVAPYYIFLEGGYLVTPKIQAFAGYTLALETYTFTGTSERDPGNLNSERKDVQHLLSVGAQYWF